MRRHIGVGSRAALVCVAGFVVSCGLAMAQQKNQKAADQPVYSTIRDIMDSIIDPSSDVLWGAAGTVTDKDGVHDLLPTTPEAWHDVRRAAVRMIEGGNLLMMPGRAAAPAGTKSEAPGVELEPPEITALIKKNRKSFDAFAKALQSVSVDALRAIDAKDGNALLDIGEKMENVCEACHQTFWYPNASNPKPRK
jgi:hypothetical protein